MADAKSGTESQQKMTCAALICRKIAILHPALMLRQLPMMGWLLRGRAHLTMSEFKNQNHKHVFVNTFSILELLRPLLFRSSQVTFCMCCFGAFKLSFIPIFVLGGMLVRENGLNTYFGGKLYGGSWTVWRDTSRAHSLGLMFWFSHPICNSTNNIHTHTHTHTHTG